MLIALIVVLIILVMLIVFSFVHFNIACNRNNKTFLKVFKKMGMYSTKRYNLDNVEWLKQQETKDLYITSDDGLKLHATYLKAKNSQRTVVCVHGYRGRAQFDFSPMYKYFYENGTSVVLLDSRGCGKSEGKYITYGAKEKKDVYNWVKYISSEIDGKTPIYLYGISMGASTALLSLEYDMPNNFKGVIADCGYLSMKYICGYLFNKVFHLPSFFVSIMNIFCILIGKFNMSDTEVKNSLVNNRHPILYIHGEADTFVIPENTRINYANTKEPKEIEWVSGANHGESFIVSFDSYIDKLEYFFDKYR